MKVVTVEQLQKRLDSLEDAVCCDYHQAGVDAMRDLLETLISEAEDLDEYDYVQDDFNFDAARERRL